MSETTAEELLREARMIRTGIMAARALGIALPVGDKRLDIPAEVAAIFEADDPEPAPPQGVNPFEQRRIDNKELAIFLANVISEAGRLIEEQGIEFGVLVAAPLKRLEAPTPKLTPEEQIRRATMEAAAAPVTPNVIYTAHIPTIGETFRVERNGESFIVVDISRPSGERLVSWHADERSAIQWTLAEIAEGRLKLNPPARPEPAPKELTWREAARRNMRVLTPEEQRRAYQQRMQAELQARGFIAGQRRMTASDRLIRIVGTPPAYEIRGQIDKARHEFRDIRLLRASDGQKMGFFATVDQALEFARNLISREKQSG